VKLLGGIAVLLAFAALAAGRASAASLLVVTGRGWGHGVGMSQWGADGYARHGWSYTQILAHYYPGTSLGRTGEPTVRVLLEQGASTITVGCATPMSVSDATGRGHPLAAGTYGVGPRLVFPIVRRRARHPHPGQAAPPALGRALRSPVVLECARSPLTLDGRAYHGRIVIRSAGGRLSVVNSLPLDTYVRGVVGAEMPSHWSPAALEAQAVAARSYAVATLHPGQPFDEYPDDRSQRYGGIAAEGPQTDLAVAATHGQVLTWNGRVATTLYSSSSGGRTADVRDLWPNAGDVPYLRSVSDPYDRAAPHHVWGPIVLTPERLGERLGLGSAVASVRIERSPTGRAAAVDLGLASGGSLRLTGEKVERALRLRSRWFSVGQLSLAASRARVLYGREVQLVARASGMGTALLQRRDGGGAWKTVSRVASGASVTTRPSGSTRYRLSAGGVGGPTVAVSVAPRVWVRPLGRELLAGRVSPRTSGAVAVLRRVSGGWRVVARPRLDPAGVFRTRFHLRAGSYRIAVGGDRQLAATEARLRVTKRLLASFRR
jgi:stage II sporulation protein D